MVGVQHHFKSAAAYSSLGLEIALSVLFGLLGGQWLEKKLPLGGWLTLAGLAFGIAAAGRAIYRALARANREAEQAEALDQQARADYHDETQRKP